MEDIHRTAIKKSWTTLINSITNDQLSNIMDFLVENEILTFGMKEEIECEQITSNKNRKLMTIIPKRGPRAFGLFVEALLQNRLNHIVDVLLSNVMVPPTRVEPVAVIPSTHDLPPPVVEPVADIPSTHDLSGPSITATPTTIHSTLQNDATECNICMSDTISVALTPCGHTLCSSCGDRFWREGTCCFCKQPVANFIRIFI